MKVLKSIRLEEEDLFKLKLLGQTDNISEAIRKLIKVADNLELSYDVPSYRVKDYSVPSVPTSPIEETLPDNFFMNPARTGDKPINLHG